jgi:hypothetical protein
VEEVGQALLKADGVASCESVAQKAEIQDILMAHTANELRDAIVLVYMSDLVQIDNTGQARADNANSCSGTRSTTEQD